MRYGLLCIIICSMPAYAAQKLEEVIVTSRKISLAAQEFPGSVSVVNQQALTDLQATNLEAIRNETPGLFISANSPLSGSNNSAVVYLRGVGQTEFLLTNDPGIGIYTDGVYMPRSQGAIGDTLDVNRVEILRGPQGLLYGRNTLGGAINVFTNRPDFAADSLELSVVGGENDRREVSAIANLTVNQVMALRVAAAQRSVDGYAKRLADGKELGDENSEQFRTSLALKPSDTLSMDWQFDSNREKGNAAPTVLGMDSAAQMTALANQSTLVGLYNQVVGVALPAPAPCCGTNALYDGRYFTGSDDKTWATGPYKTHFDGWGTGLTINWTALPVAIKSITAYRQFNSDAGRDADQSPLVIIHTRDDIDQDQLSQEFQFSGDVTDQLHALGGLYYFAETGRDKLIADILPDLYTYLNLPLSLDGYYDVDNTSKAIYGQLSWDLTSQWQLTAGVRRSIESKGYTNHIYQQNTGVFLIPEKSYDTTFTHWNGEVSAKYQINADALWYTSLANGFKSGGYVARYIVPATQPTTFNEENIWTLETGVKTSWFDDRLNANLSTYYSDYDDIQLLVYQGIIPLTQNAGNGRITGTDAEVVWQMTDNWQWHNQITYTDTDYLDLNANSPVQKSDAFPYTAQWSAVSGLGYTRPLSAQYVLHGMANYVWQSAMALDAINTPQLKQGSYGVVDASITLDDTQNNYSLQLYGHNLTDKDFRYSGAADIPTFGAVEVAWARPREVGVALTLRY